MAPQLLACMAKIGTTIIDFTRDAPCHAARMHGGLDQLSTEQRLQALVGCCSGCCEKHVCYVCVSRRNTKHKPPNELVCHGVQCILEHCSGLNARQALTQQPCARQACDGSLGAFRGPTHVCVLCAYDEAEKGTHSWGSLSEQFRWAHHFLCTPL